MIPSSLPQRGSDIRGWGTVEAVEILYSPRCPEEEFSAIGLPVLSVLGNSGLPVSSLLGISEDQEWHEKSRGLKTPAR
jgi:hypothetical protein